MIQVNNSEQLQKWLLESRHLGRLWDRPRFHFDPVEFAQELEIVATQYPRFSKEEAEARTALRLLGKEEALARKLELVARRRTSGAEKWLIAAIVMLVGLLCIALRVRGADGPLARPAGWRARGRPEGYRSELGRARLGRPPEAGQGQPGGIIIQVANQGTILATRPAGLLQFNCSTAMSCSFSGTTFTLTSTGGGGGSPAWSSILAPIGNLGINHAAFTTTFTWGAATGAGVNLFNLIDTLNNTGTGALLNLNTASGSALLPFQATALGSANGVQIDTTGLLKAIGTGGINATKYKGGTASGTGNCGANNWVNALNDAAAPGCAQINFSNLSGTAPKGQLPGTTVYTDQSNAYTTGTQDSESAAVTRPFRRLAFASFPANCTANREFLERSDPAVAGQVIYVCNATGNGWDLVGDGGGGGGCTGTVVCTGQTNTYTAGDQSMASAATLEIPVSAGATGGTTNGRVAYNSTQETYKYGDSVLGATSGVRVLCALFSTTDIVNATDSGATSGNGKAFATTCTIPANAIIANKVFRVSAVFDVTAATSPNVTVRLVLEKAGPTDVVLFQSGTVALSAQTNIGYGFTWTVQGTAAPGAAVAVEIGVVGAQAPTGGNAAYGNNQLAQGINVDTTSAQTIKIFLLYSAATAGNSQHLRQLIGEVLN